MTKISLPDFRVPDEMAPEEMPDLLRYWYLGSRARHYMMHRRFSEVDGEITSGPGGSVLDIGSGWGYNPLALRLLGYQSVGLDLVVAPFQAGARIAAANRAVLVAIAGDASRLPFRNGCFDCVTMVETFEHIYAEDRLITLRECHRVLRAGGRLILSTPNYGGIVERFKRFIVRHPALMRRLPTMCYPAGSVSRDGYHPYSYHKPFTVKEMTNMLEEAGFRVVKTKRFLFMLKNTPNALYPFLRMKEWVLERLPFFRGLASTVCIVSDRK